MNPERVRSGRRVVYAFGMIFAAVFVFAQVPSLRAQDKPGPSIQLEVAGGTTATYRAYRAPGKVECPCWLPHRSGHVLSLKPIAAGHHQFDGGC